MGTTNSRILGVVTAILVGWGAGNASADQVIADDLIVQGSECVGFDCVNNESFGFDTIRLKENNTRLSFQDTSATTGFPANDWQLTANDSASGGANKFSIEDITGSKVPFTITAGAATNSIFVDSTGKVGFRTSTPVLDLHTKTNNTPALRLEQDNTGGFTAQTWDIGANEANFFVRDVTGGSKLSLRIRPGAPTSSIDIGSDGNVGVGASSISTAALFVSRSTGAAAGILKGKNNGGSFIQLENSATSSVWSMTSQHLSPGSFILDNTTAGVGDGPEFILTTGGNLTVQGTCTATSHINSSSRTVKDDFVEVDPSRVLEAVDRLPILTWKYSADRGGTRHIGPMAEDFHAAFGVGADARHIDTVDTAGVALAAIQALSRENAALKARLDRLEKLLAEH